MSEIGIIGQIYEDRRTKKRGKLIERDDKYKTLLLESEDGKSFNISFGGFKSNWRSVDEPIETLEEAMQEVEIPEEPEVKPVKQKKERNISEGLESAVLKLLEYVKSFSNSSLKTGTIPKKRMVFVKTLRRRLFIVTYLTRTKKYKIYVPETLFLLIKDNAYVQDTEYHDNWINTKYQFLIPEDKFDTFLDDVRDYVIDCINE